MELPELRSERSKTYRMPNGSLRTRIYETPIHVRTPEGSLVPIDTDLVPDASPNRYRTALAPYAISMGAEAVGLAPVTIGRDGWSVSLDLVGAAEREPIVLANMAAYTDVLQDTDLLYESMDDGLKETLILRSADAPTSYRFALKLSGAELRETRAGQWGIFRPGRPTPELRVGALLVWDSSKDEYGEPSYCPDARMDLQPTADGAVISYEIPEKWLKDPAREFPVMVDPSLGASEDTFIKSAYPTSSYGGLSNLRVGKEGASYCRSYVNFDIASEAPTESYLHKSTFDVYLYSNGTANSTTYLNRTLTSWDEGCTWNSKPTHAQIATKVIPAGSNQWVEWDVTGVTRQWIARSVPPHGFAMTQLENGTQDSSYYLRYFCSSEAASETLRPYMQIDHEIPIATVTGYSSSYAADDFDVVSASIVVTSAFVTDIREVHLAPNRAAGDPSRYRGHLAWFSTDPGAGWTKVNLGSGLGYLAHRSDASEGACRITPLLDQSSATTTSGSRIVNFKWKLKPDYGDVQDNDLDTLVAMGSTSTVWSSGWKSQDTNIDVVEGTAGEASPTPECDTYVKSGAYYENNSYGGSSNLYIGKSGIGYHRSFARFDVETPVPAGAYLHSAYLRGFPYLNGASSTKTYLGRCTNSFDDSSTWLDQPTFAYVASQTVAGGPNKWVEWEVTGLSRQWLEGQLANDGFAMYQLTDGSQDSADYFRGFCSSESSTESARPVLELYYDQPEAVASADKAAYFADDNDVVTASVEVSAAFTADVRAVEMAPNREASVTARYRGHLGWFATDPGSGWEKRDLGGGLGWLASETSTAVGGDKITALLNDSSTTLTAGKRLVTLKYKLKDTYGDIQDNDLDTKISMGTTSTVWDSGWVNQDTNFGVLPKPVTQSSCQGTRGLDWWRAVDRDDDGVADNANDVAVRGRGQASLSWSAPSGGISGYRIMAHDGYAFRQVGLVPTGTVTSWDTTASAAFPTDSKIASMSANATASAFAGASTPSPESLEDSFQTQPTDELSVEGAGVTVSDGTYLYVRAWGDAPGPTAWTKVGSGYSTTTAGKIYGTVGPDESALGTDQPRSGLFMDGFLYAGYAHKPPTSPWMLKGVWKGASDEETATSTLSLTQPPLARATGAAITSPTGDILMAADSEHVYSVAYSLGSGLNGFKVREYTRDGAYTADHTIACDSYMTDGVMADGEAIYMVEYTGDDSARVTKIRTGDWEIVNQWTIDQGTTGAVSGAYDPVRKVFWMGELDAPGGDASIHRFSGPGLDLRDNPNALYQKMATTVLDDAQTYAFKVVPYNVAGDADIASCATITVQLPNRTVGANDDPRHTTYGLDGIAGHTAEAVLDERSLRLDVTDLEIASWGPVAAVSRVFDSTFTAATGTRFAPGWRFNFDQALVVGSTTATYTDEQGQNHRFVATDTAWFAPNGFDAELTQQGSDWRLTSKDRSYLTFGSNGRLKNETDANGNATTYTWSSGSLTITAANGQEIDVTFNEHQDPTLAAYETTAGTRRVEYSRPYMEPPAPFLTAYVTSNPSTDDSCAVAYHYEKGADGTYAKLLTDITVTNFDSSGTVPAAWECTYTAGDELKELRLPGYSQDAHRRTEFNYGTASASITRYGQVDGVDDVPIIQAYAWNPTRTEAWHTQVKSSQETTALWRYEYSPTNQPMTELYPLGKEVHRVFDADDNLLFEYDEDGHTTSYISDGYHQVIRQTDPRGSTTHFNYDSHGNVTAEERVLTSGGDRSRTERTYDGQGRLTSEKRKIDVSTWAETTYSNHAPNGEPQTQVDKGVKLSTTATAQDLTTHKSYDAFGNLMSETDALGTTTSESTFTISGRMIWSRDASGTCARHAYNALGQEIETSKTAGAAFADWTKKVVDPEGETVAETYFVKDGPDVVVDHTVDYSHDPAGREVRSVGSVEGTTTDYLDAAGNTVEQWVPQASGSTRAAFDVEDRETSRRDAGNDASSSTTYLPDGKTPRRINADGTWTEYRYDEAGNEIAELTPSEEGTTTSTSRWDVGGRLISSTNADGATAVHSYDLLDRQTSAQGDEGSGGASGPSTTVYNTLGWVLYERDADGADKAKHYDAAGRVIREVVNPTEDGLIRDGSFETDVLTGATYDVDNFAGDGIADDWGGWAGEPPSVAYSLDSTHVVTGTHSQKLVFSGGASSEVEVLRAYTAPWSYTLGRNAIATCWMKGSAQGATVKLRLVAVDNYGDPMEDPPFEASQTVNLTDEFQKVQIVYDDHYPNGPSEWTQRMRLEVVVFDYDQGDTVELYCDDASVVYAAPGQNQLYDQVTMRAYSPIGSLLQEVSPDGAVKTAAYDAFQRTTEETETREGETLKAVSTRYDELGRTTSRTNAVNGVRTTATHARNGVSGTSASLSYADATATASIDGSGRELSRRASVGSIETSRVITAWDAAGRVTSWTWNTNVTSTAVGAGYDGSGRLESLSGLGFGAGGALFTYSQATGKKTAESYDLAFEGPSADITASYACTEGGRLATATIGSTTTVYAYDLAGNLTTAGALALRYDENNRLTRTELSGTTETVFSFDERGRRVTEGPPSAPGQRAYIYDNPDRLVSIIDTATESTATFAYDAAGQRTRSVVTTIGGTSETTYTYEGLTLLAIESRTDTRTTKLAYLYDGSGRPYAGVVTLDDTPPILFGMVTTHRGDVVELVDVVGEPFALYLYDAYGNPTGMETTATPGGPSAQDAATIAEFQPLRYAGYCFDTFSGLYYLSARYYDPLTCQFITKDPAKADGQESAYHYCGGDPVQLADHSGRKPGGYNPPPRAPASGRTAWTVSGWTRWANYWEVRFDAVAVWQWIYGCGDCHGPDLILRTELELTSKVKNIAGTSVGVSIWKYVRPRDSRKSARKIVWMKYRNRSLRNGDTYVYGASYHPDRDGLYHESRTEDVSMIRIYVYKPRILPGDTCKKVIKWVTRPGQ